MMVVYLSMLEMIRLAYLELIWLVIILSILVWKLSSLILNHLDYALHVDPPYVRVRRASNYTGYIDRLYTEEMKCIVIGD